MLYDIMQYESISKMYVFVKKKKNKICKQEKHIKM